MVFASSNSESLPRAIVICDSSMNDRSGLLDPQPGMDLLAAPTRGGEQPAGRRRSASVATAPIAGATCEIMLRGGGGERLQEMSRCPADCY